MTITFHYPLADRSRTFTKMSQAEVNSLITFYSKIQDADPVVVKITVVED